MARAARPQPEVKLNITPLIDVTFLLLIFFMCAMRFKTLERKVGAYLPKEYGGNPWPAEERPPRIEVWLKRARGEAHTRVKLNDRELGRDEAGFAALEERIRRIHAVAPALGGQINAWAEVPHRDVVRTIDAFMRSGVREITFRGTPRKGRPAAGPGDPRVR